MHARHARRAQAGWNDLFEDLEDYIERMQDGAEDSATLQSGIDKFKAARRTTARQNVGLDARVDGTWTQEYAASPASLSLNWFDNDKELSGGDTILKGGYSQVVQHLHDQLTARGGRVVLNAPVASVAYSAAQRVTVRTVGLGGAGALAPGRGARVRARARCAQLARAAAGAGRTHCRPPPQRAPAARAAGDDGRRRHVQGPPRRRHAPRGRAQVGRREVHAAAAQRQGGRHRAPGHGHAEQGGGRAPPGRGAAKRRLD